MVAIFAEGPVPPTTTICLLVRRGGSCLLEQLPRPRHPMISWHLVGLPLGRRLMESEPRRPDAAGMGLGERYRPHFREYAAP